jgi:putative phage-type endonuclease
MKMKSRKEWLRERKQYLTASDVAAVINAPGAFRNILDVYIDKTTDEISEYDSPILKYGRYMEPFTAELYAEQTGREVRDPGATEIAVHPDIPWLGATLDREVLVCGRWWPLEIKQVNDPRYIFRADEWVEDLPEQYYIQCQAQAACKQTDMCSITGQFPGCVMANADMEYDAEFFEMAYPDLDEFWNHNVKKRIPPEVPDHPKALQSTKRLYRGDSRFTVALDKESTRLADEMAKLRSESRRCDGDAKRIEAILRGMIGNANFGALNDGTFLTRKLVHRKGYYVEPTEYWQIGRSKNLR